ncbi:MAG: radical SAM family heme chaperone HemW [Vicinamibacterales bacterium]
MAGLYLHIPFCQAICAYCNFTRGLLDDAVKAAYLDALAADLRRQAEPVVVESIYLGGGTPSLLTPGELGFVLAACRDSFAVAPDAEVTVECNPESVSPQSLAGYRAAGVNRLSFGAQSFRADELARLGRLHSPDRPAAAVAEARAAGFANVSLDLMLWLPGQTPAHARESVDRLIAVGPEHASLYLLEIYPNAPLRDSMARAGWSVAPDDDAADMYLEAMAALEAAGYRQYEISNVSRPNLESRHNLNYWRDGDWLAFGCGAHGARGDRRWRVVADTGEYIARVRAGAPTVAEWLPRDRATRLEEALFMGLRLTDGIDLVDIRRRYDVDVWARYGERLGPFERAGHLVHDPGRRIRLTRPGMLVANEAMTIFLDRENRVE